MNEPFGKPVREIAVPGVACAALAVDPGGWWLAAAPAEGPVTIVDTVRAAVVRTLPGAQVRALSWSASGRWLAVTSSARETAVFEAKTARLAARIPGNLAQFGPTGEVLAIITGASVELWRPDKESFQKSAGSPSPLATGGATIDTAAFTPDGRLLIAGTSHGEVRLLDLSLMKLLSGAYRFAAGAVSAVASDRLARRIVAASSTGRVQLLSLDDLRELSGVETGDDAPAALAWGTQSTDAVLGLTRAGRLRAWDTQGAALSTETAAGSASAFAVAAGTLYTAQPGLIAMRDVDAALAQPRPRAPLELLHGESYVVPGEGVRSFAIEESRTGWLLLTGSESGSVTLWSPDGPETRAVALLARLPAPVGAVALARSAPRAAARSGDELFLIEFANPNAALVVNARVQATGPFALSADGARLAAATPDSVMILDTVTAAVVQRIDSRDSTGLALSPDGSAGVLIRARSCASWSSEGAHEHILPPNAAARAVAWSPAAGPVIAYDSNEVRHVLELATGRTHTVPRRRPDWRRSFSSDAACLASHDLEMWVELWNVAGAEPIGSFGTTRHTLGGPARPTTLLQISVSPRHVACLVAGDDRSSVQVWRTSTIRERFRFNAHRGAVTGLAFRLDDAALATVAADRTLRLHDLHSGDELACRELDADPGSGVAFIDGASVALRTREHALLISDPTGVTQGPPARRVWGFSEGQAPRVLLSTNAGGLELRDLCRGNRMLQAPGDAVHFATCSRDGRVVAAIHRDGTITLASPEAEPREIARRRPPVDGLLLSPSGTWLAVSSRNAGTTLYRLLDESRTVEIPWSAGVPVACLEHLLVGIHLGRVVLTDPRTGTLLGNFGESVASVALSECGTLLAAGGTDGQVYVYEIG